MSPERKRLFGCPVCGFRVTGSEDACPRCGTKYGDGTKFECPFCGEHVDPVSPKCPSCRVSYEEFHQRTDKEDSDESIDTLLTEIISLESEQVKQEDKRLSCPRCSWLLDGSEEKCPKCGAGFLEDVSYQCPICAAMVRADEARCPECATLFSEGDELAVEVPDLAPAETIPADEPALVTEAPAEEPAAETMPEPAPVLEEPRPETVAAAVDEMPKETSEEPAVQEPATEEKVEEPPPAEVPKAEPVPEAKPKQRKLKTRKVKVKQ